MRYLIITALLGFILPAHSYAASLDIELQPGIPKMGRQEVILTIKPDPHEKNISWNIEGQAIMLPTPQMPQMQSQIKLESLENLKYKGRFNISMEGEWILFITLKEDKNILKFYYRIHTGMKNIEKLKDLPISNTKENTPHKHH